MKFIFDENLPPGIAKGLHCFGEDVEHVSDYFAPGTTDVDILKFVGDNGYILVTKDKRMRYNESERLALRRYNVGAFFLVAKTMTIWDIVKQLINSWPNIKEIAEKEKKPFIYTLRARGGPKRYNI